jgi:hypothetical protein
MARMLLIAVGLVTNGSRDVPGPPPARPPQFAVATEPVVSLSHLSAVFGPNELCAELIGLVDMPAFKKAYPDYCRYFNATEAEQTARYGSNSGRLPFFRGHSRLDAYAAVRTGDKKLAARAREKANRVCTNDTALYGLAVIENLALVGDQMPA